MSNTYSKVMEYHISNLTPEEKENMNYFLRKLKEGEFYFSPSGLKKLLDNPMAFFKEYVCDLFEDKTTLSMEKGTLVHTLLLEPEEFDNRYFVLPDDIKAPEDRMLSLITKVLELGGKSTELRDYEQDILELMILDNYHQNLVDDKKIAHLTGDFKRLEKVLTEDNIVYFRTMQEGNGKKVINRVFYDEALQKAEIVKLISKSENFRIENDSQDVIFEIDLFANIPTLKYPVHSIIDVLKIDVEKKKIIVTDLKTTASTLESVIKWDIEKYRYGIQAAINLLCVIEFTKSEVIKSEIPNIEDFHIEYNFAFIDGNNCGYVLPVSEVTMSRFVLETTNYINETAHEHFELFDFSAPLQFLKNSVIL